MVISWILTVLTSVIIGILVTLAVQYYIFTKHFKEQESSIPEKKLKLEAFQLPKVKLFICLNIYMNQGKTKMLSFYGFFFELDIII